MEEEHVPNLDLSMLDDVVSPAPQNHLYRWIRVNHNHYNYHENLSYSSPYNSSGLFNDDFDLHSMRAQSAATGLTGTYMHHQSYSPYHHDNYDQYNNLAELTVNGTNSDLSGRSQSPVRRAQSAAAGRMGAYVQPRYYSPNEYYDQNNLAELTVMNGIHDNLSSLFSSRLNLNGAANDYQPRGTYQNPFDTSYPGLQNQLNSIRNLRVGDSYSSDSGNFSPYRSNRGMNCSSPGDLRRMNIYSTAMDGEGCVFLVKKFGRGNPEEVHVIFNVVRDRIHELMVNPCGSYLVKKILKLCNEEQMNQLVLAVTDDIRSLQRICCTKHGRGVMLELLENLKTSYQKYLMVSALRDITVSLTENINGHHIIECCLRCFSSEENKPILNEIANNCLVIATQKLPCCVLQQCVTYAEGEPLERLIAEITASALVLSYNDRGNYVVQHVLKLRSIRVTDEIVAKLAGSFVGLSMDKFGSNVVQKILELSEEYQSLKVVNEIVNSPFFLMVVKDPYGNYVAQSILKETEGDICAKAATLILKDRELSLNSSHPHWKKLMACARACKHR